MKNFNVFFLLLLTLVCLSFSSCPTPNSNSICNVKFYRNDGSVGEAAIYKEVLVVKGETTIEPKDPLSILSGYKFNYWSSAPVGIAFDFSHRITGDTILYAQWVLGDEIDNTELIDSSISAYDVVEADENLLDTISDDFGTQNDDVKEIPEYEFEHFIGKGYNFFDKYADEASCCEQVLNYEELLKDAISATNTTNSQTYEYVYGKTEEELLESYNIKTSLDTSLGGFSGSLKSNFGSSATKKAVTAFVSTQIVIPRYAERIKASYFNQLSTDAQGLRPYLITDVKNRLDNVNSVEAASSFIAIYGTHVVANSIIGGRYEYNSYTESIEVTSAEEFSAAISVKVKKIFGADVEYSQNEEYKNAAENSRDTGFTIGGSGESQAAILSKLNTENWKAWASSFDNHANWTLAAFPKTTETGTPALLPVWYLVDKTKSNYNEIIAYFKEAIRLLSEQRKNKPVVAKYLKDLRRYTGEKLSAPEVKYFEVGVGVKEAFYLLGDTFNRGTGEDRDCFLYYSMTGDPEEAITDINIQVNQVPREDWINVGDMNWGNPGEAWVYLSYDKGGTNNTPLTAIAQKNGDKLYISKMPSETGTGFVESDLSEDDFIKFDQDINTGNGGNYVYLWYSRVE